MRWKDVLLYLAKKLKGELHPRISLKLFFGVEPALYSIAPYYDTLEEATREALNEDKFAQQFLDEDGIPKKWKENAKHE